MNFRRSPSAIPASEKLLADVARIECAWADARARFGQGGPFLFGAFCAADAMFAPVAWRFEAYALPVSSQARAYIDAVKGLQSWREWEAGARSEDWVIEQFTVA